MDNFNSQFMNIDAPFMVFENKQFQSDLCSNAESQIQYRNLMMPTFFETSTASNFFQEESFPLPPISTKSKCKKNSVNFFNLILKSFY